MPLRAHRWALLPGLALVLASCHDGPAGPANDVAPTDPVHQRGGNGKGNQEPPPPPPADLVALGGLLFADEALSVHANQSCQTCHEPSQGFAAPLAGAVTRGSVVEGSHPGQFGDRKPPSAAYATPAPLFVESGNGATGGLFWDGRATGDVLGSPAADQALGPFLNPKEQGFPDAACVIWKVAGAAYFETHWVPAWGDDVASIAWPAHAATFCGTWSPAPAAMTGLSAEARALVDEAYGQVARSIASFETSVNTFSSPFDQGQLDAAEQRGQKLFSTKGKCQQCHENRGSQPLFTDFAFHNLGVPHNPANPVYPDASAGFDPGLGGVTGSSEHLGRFRTPTLRNVGEGVSRTYMHNGAFVSLEQVVQFYNTRDVLPVCRPDQDDPARWGPGGYGCWPAPEYPENLDTRNMGNLGLSADEVADIVAYLEALTDTR